MQWKVFLPLLLFSGFTDGSDIKCQSVCENSQLNIQCPGNELVSITSAIYGRQEKNTCPSYWIWTTNCKASRSYSTVDTKCKGQNSCSVKASNSVFGGDPCRGTNKYMKVCYTCIPSEFVDGVCVRDDSSRLLDKRLDSSTNTPEECRQKCSSLGYEVAGVQYGYQCYCGNQLPSEDRTKHKSQCNKPCSGDPSKMCGGSWRMNVYGYKPAPEKVGMFESHKYDGTASKNDWHYVSITKKDDGNYKWTNRAGVSWTLYPTEESNLKSGQSTLRVGEDSPYYSSGYTKAVFTNDGVYGPYDEFYKFEGKVNGQCYDSKSRSLPHVLHAGRMNSVDYCKTYCFEKGYIYAGAEAWDWCFCGNNLTPASMKKPSSECNKKCPADSSQMCGQGWRMNVHMTQRVDGQCYEDSDSKMLPQSLNAGETNSVDSCKSFCVDNGYTFAGVQDGTWCYCGNSPAPAIKMRPDAECRQPCPGDATQSCGKKNRMLVFSLKNSSPKGGVVERLQKADEATGWPLECSNGRTQSAPVWLADYGKPVAITSPNYPFSFNASHLDCTWEVNAEFGTKVKMTVIKTDVNSGCAENSLEAYDDTPANGNSPLAYPGYSAKCGDSSFPSAIEPVTANGALTLKFSSDNNDGSVRFKMLFEATYPTCPSPLAWQPREYTCPNGPCCEGVDCCVIHLGTYPSEINSPNYPYDSGMNKKCQYKLVAPEGSRVSINFQDMDMRRDKVHTCLNDHVHIVDPLASASSVIGTEGVKFCGQHLPNYPGPSVFVSAGNTMIVKYKTDATNVKRGRGFLADVSAINPFCSEMRYSQAYGEQECTSMCAPDHIPTTMAPKTTTTPIPTYPDGSRVTTTTPKPTYPDGSEVTTPGLTDPTDGSPVTNPDGSWVTEPRQVTDQDGSTVTNDAGDVVTESPKPWTGLTDPTNGSPVTNTDGSWVTEPQYVTDPDGSTVTNEDGSWVTESPKPTYPDGSEVTTPGLTDPTDGNPVTNPDGSWVTEPLRVTDQDGSTITNDAGDLVTESPRPTTAGLTDASGSPIINPDGSWVTEPRRVTDRDGSTVTYPDGSVVTEPQVVTDQDGSTITNPDGSWVTEPRTVTNQDGSTVTYPDGTVVTEPQAVTDQDGSIITNPDGSFVSETVKPTYPDGNEVTTEGLTDASGSPVTNPDGSWATDSPPAPTNKDGSTIRTTMPPTGPDGSTLTTPTLPATDPTDGSIITTTTEQPCQETEVSFEIDVISLLTGEPIPNAIVNISSVLIDADAPNSILHKTKKSGIDGKVVEEVKKTGGNFKISVSAEEFYDKSINVLVECDQNLCGECYPFATVELTKRNDTTEETCKDVKMSFTVNDALSHNPLSGAQVLIYLTGDDNTDTEIADATTNMQGKVNIPINANGEYKIAISKDKYDTLETTSTIACDISNCPACDTYLTSNLTKPFCNGTEAVKMVIHVRDETDDDIADANVEVSLVGFINTPVGENLASDSNGKVEVTIPNNGVYRVSVEKEGFNPNGLEEDVQCDVDNCGACSPIVIIRMKNAPPPDHRIIPCENQTTTFKLNVFDNLTHAVLPNAKISISYEIWDETYFLVENANPDEDGNLVRNISIIGDYNVLVTADGYEVASQVVNVLCTKDSCEDCNTELEIPLTQEFCEESNLQIVVKDSVSGIPLAGASVTVVMIGNNHNETLAPEDPLTDINGLVVVPVTGNADYLVKISKDGFNGYKGTNQIVCSVNHCDACNPVIDVDLTQPFCEEDMTVDITIVDEKSQTPIEGVKVNLVLIYSLAGPSAVDVGGDLVTDADGKVKPPVNVDGWYQISVESDEYLNKIHAVEVNSNASCDPPKVKLELDPMPGPFCPDETMVVTVVDEHTQKPIPSAKVNIVFHELYEGSYLINEFASEQTTDAEGKVTVPVNANGNFSVGVEPPVLPGESQYDSATGVLNVMCSIHDCENCDAKITIPLDQKRCPSTEIPITVRDALLHQPIPNALVTLVLIDSISGPSYLPVGQPKLTNENGTAVFPASMNGQYNAIVEKDNYVSGEQNTSVECSILNCEACTPVLDMTIKSKFCEDVSLTVVIKDGVDNKAAEGATVTVTMAGYLQAVHVGTAVVDEGGIMTFPIEGNGFYTVSVAKEGYITMTKTMEVNTTMEKCDILAPIEIFPLSPDLPCIKGARVSLSWNDQPMDLDLFSYRIKESDVANRCLTYYCDQKELCGCTTFETDNTGGGLNGSETITYCCKDNDSHMIYVDDQSGKGSSLLSSGAQLTIVGEERSQRLRMDPSAAGDKHRYWLAGCLTLSEAGFEFIEVNTFSEERPSIENPLLCHNLVSLARMSKLPYSLPANVSVQVTVRDAISNLLLEGASVEVSTRSESHARTSDVVGEASIAIDHNGIYKVDVDLEGYASASTEVHVACDSEENCNPAILVSLSPSMEAGNIRIVLNWNETPLDMDLYSLEVNKEEDTDNCLVYFQNMDGCSSASLDQNNQDGGERGAETITYRDVSANARYTHMIYVDDFSGQGESLAQSDARITVTDGKKSITVPMPSFDEYTSAGVRYWFAGCMKIIGDSYKFIPQGRFSRAKPSDSDKFFCDKLFQDGGVNTDGIDVEPFCDNAEMKIKVHNGITNDGITGAIADVHYVHNDTEQMVIEGAVSVEDGSIAVPISKNGEYLINVKADGYVRDQIYLTVQCDIASCSTCKPVTLVSLSPELERGDLRIMMNWNEKPTDLDIYTFQVNTDDRRLTCLTNWNNKDVCRGVTLDKDNARGGTNGAETMTFNDVTSNDNYVYMVYVKDYSRNPEEFSASNVHLTITDGVDITKVNLNTRNYEDERYWLTGCMRIVGESFEFVPANAFMNEDPKDAVPKYCLDLFGLNVDPTACFEDNIDYAGNDMNDGNKNKKASVVECRKSCLTMDGCVGFAWNKRTTDCWLKPTMVQGPKNNNEITSGFAVCDDPTAPPPPRRKKPWYRRVADWFG